MKVILPMMVQDQSLAGVGKLAEGFAAEEPYFLDGPVTERVAILDFDEKTGAIRPGARFHSLNATAKSGKRGIYRDEKGKALEFKKKDEDGKNRTQYRIRSRAFNQVSLPATILKTMYLFEAEEVLGRRLRWAFDSLQLLVIPRAGEWANAFYQRETHSLQFYYFRKRNGAKDFVYTSLSRDVVSHETAHAILDGIVPDLYNASTPQSLAFHETFADLTAVLMAFKSNNLVSAILEKTRGHINQPNEFSQIAEEFGQEHQGTEALRTLHIIKPIDEAGIEPHALSVVLSSVLYAMMLKLYQQRWDERTTIFEKVNQQRAGKNEPPKFEDPRFSASGRALAVAANDFARMIYGALDYLPPGEISFADFGRAIVAAQKNLIHHPRVAKSEKQRATERIQWVKESFKKGKIIRNENELDAPAAEPARLVKFNHVHESVQGVELHDLVESDWVAYQFANENRAYLQIPDDIPFAVRPRLQTEKLIYKRPHNNVVQHQIFFKVAWTILENNEDQAGMLPAQRRVTVGTTLVIDVDTHEVIALLHTDHNKHLTADRDKMLALLVAEDYLKLNEQALGPDNKPLSSVIHAEDTNGVLRLYGVTHMLHLTG